MLAGEGLGVTLLYPWPATRLQRWEANTNQLVIESKEHMQKRGQASPDDGDALVLTFAAPVLPPAKEEVDEDDEEFAPSYHFSGPGGWMR